MLQAKLSFGKDKAMLLLIITLSALVFSHHPFVSLGSISGVHAELSFIYFLVIASIVVSLPLILRWRLAVTRSPLYITLFGLLAFMALSLLWTSNPIRGLITTGFFLLLISLGITISSLYKDILQNKGIVLKALFITYALTLFWAVWQIAGDLLGIDRTYTLLPSMYEGDVFGIARPTGFTLEPQFLASILLIPLVFGLHRTFSGKYNRFSFITMLVVSTIFFLTLSRGAFLGLAVVLVVLLLTYRPSWSRFLRSLSPIVLGLLMMLVFVFLGASLRQDNISGYDALRRTVSHVSLGVFTLPAQPAEQPATISAPRDETRKSSTGYIKDSTTSRISMSQQAVNIWTESPNNFIFGVGVGGFGTSLEPSRPSAIVNNYYLELLVETGLIGFCIFLAFLASLGVKLIQLRAWLLLALLAGLLTQALFFSGNANIIHIWAIIGLAIGLVMNKKLPKASPSHLVQ